MKSARLMSLLIRFGQLSLLIASLSAIPFMPADAASSARRDAGAKGPPTLDVAPSCEAAARGAIVSGRNKEACMGDEQAALDQAKKDWSTYAAVDKTQCVELVNKGGPPSYVELVSCLEIMRDARIIHLGLAGPLLDNGKLDSQAVPLTDLNEGTAAPSDGQRVRRRQKRTYP